MLHGADMQHATLIYKVISDSAQKCEPLVKQTRRNGIYFNRICLPWILSERVLLWYDICQTQVDIG